jgi:hypothetical protein
MTISPTIVDKPPTKNETIIKSGVFGLNNIIHKCSGERNIPYTSTLIKISL